MSQDTRGHISIAEAVVEYYRSLSPSPAQINRVVAHVMAMILTEQKSGAEYYTGKEDDPDC